MGAVVCNLTRFYYIRLIHSWLMLMFVFRYVHCLRTCFCRKTTQGSIDVIQNQQDGLTFHTLTQKSLISQELGGLTRARHVQITRDFRRTFRTFFFSRKIFSGSFSEAFPATCPTVTTHFTTLPRPCFFTLSQ